MCFSRKRNVWTLDIVRQSPAEDATQILVYLTVCAHCGKDCDGVQFP